MTSYPAGMTVSNRSLIKLADALRQRRRELGTTWRRLSAGRQALLVVAHLRKGETYRDLAVGFAVGTTTVYRCLREGLDVLAALASTLEQAVAVAARKAFVVLDGTPSARTGHRRSGGAGSPAAAPPRRYRRVPGRRLRPAPAGAGASPDVRLDLRCCLAAGGAAPAPPTERR